MSRWSKFFTGICLIAAFIWLVPRLVKNIFRLESRFDLLEERNIDPTALFYTEEAHTASGSREIKEKIDF